MLLILSIILACIALLTITLIAVSPGKPEPFRDSTGKPLEGSISEKIHISINGVDMGMFIMGKDSTKPVLLFLHGGPGMPEYAISREYPLSLENCFTVCWWDQRGAGLSYSPDIAPETMNFEQLISDVFEVTNYLRQRFNQEKIYLMAHSGGTFTGIQAAARAPELYKAYIAVSQISNQAESERLAFKYMTEQFARLGDKKMLREFAKYPVEKINTPEYYVMRDKPMHRLGIGTTHAMRSVISGVFMPVMLLREYTLSEKINVWRGKAMTTNTAGLWNKLVETNLTRKVTRLEIPVYFCHGAFDYTVSYPLAKEYFNKLETPLKAFYTFGKSAHSPLFEEPEKMQRILQEDVLKGITGLADAE